MSEVSEELAKRWNGLRERLAGTGWCNFPLRDLAHELGKNWTVADHGLLLADYLEHALDVLARDESLQGRLELLVEICERHEALEDDWGMLGEPAPVSEPEEVRAPVEAEETAEPVNEEASVETDEPTPEANLEADVEEEPEAESAVEPEPESAIEEEGDTQDKADGKPEPESPPSPTIEPEATEDAEASAVPDAKSEPEPEPKAVAEAAPEPEAEPEPESEPEPEPKPPLEETSEAKTEPEPEAEADVEPPKPAYPIPDAYPLHLLELTAPLIEFLQRQGLSRFSQLSEFLGNVEDPITTFTGLLTGPTMEEMERLLALEQNEDKQAYRGLLKDEASELSLHEGLRRTLNRINRHQKPYLLEILSDKESSHESAIASKIVERFKIRFQFEMDALLNYCAEEYREVADQIQAGERLSKLIGELDQPEDALLAQLMIKHLS